MVWKSNIYIWGRNFKWDNKAGKMTTAGEVWTTDTSSALAGPSLCVFRPCFHYLLIIDCTQYQTAIVESVMENKLFFYEINHLSTSLPPKLCFWPSEKEVPTNIHFLFLQKKCNEIPFNFQQPDHYTVDLLLLSININNLSLPWNFSIYWIKCMNT